MATFKVGDRVRLRGTDDAGSVESVGPYRVGELLRGRRMTWSPDCVVLFDDGGLCGQRFDDLEPILPTPSAADILAMESLPDFDCPLPALAALRAWNEEVARWQRGIA